MNTRMNLLTGKKLINPFKITMSKKKSRIIRDFFLMRFFDDEVSGGINVFLIFCFHFIRLKIAI